MPDSTERQESAKTESLGAQPSEALALPAADARLTDYTLWLTIFTGLLAVVAVLQLLLLRRQSVATFRPRLKLRQASAVREEGRYFVEFAVANDGDTRARIVESGATLLLRESGRALPARPLEGAIEAVPAQTVKAGASIIVRWRDDLTSKKFGEARNDSGGLTNLFFVGYITYRDDVGTIRRMGFFRTYSWEDLRFRTIDNPDFEYAD